MKTNKLIVVTDEFSCVVHLGREYNFTREEFIRLVKKANDFKGKKVLNVEDGNTYHICKYCGLITDGTDEDVLCKECRDIFGHTFYSEL